MLARVRARALILRKPHFLLLLVLTADAAGAGPVATDAYRRALETGVNTGAYQAIAAGWIDGSERQSWFFARTDKPDAASRFEIGAVSEVFTALLLAQAVYEGKVRLQTPLADLLGKDLFVAEPALGSLTLLDLATHRSGFPALPPNLMPVDTDDPYADYSELDLSALLANYRRSTEPASAAYSPLDYGLLGHAISRAYGTPFAQLLHDKVLAPLGMIHTSPDDDAALLTGHTLGQPTAHWHFGALAGTAALRSSLGDLLDFLQVNLRAQDSSLRAALLLARQPRTSSRSTQLGLGWRIVEVAADGQTWPLVWRASNTAGFSAFLGFRTDRQQALVLLGNNDVDLSALGLAWLQQQDPSTAPAPVLAVAPPANLTAYAGLYQVRGGAELIVRTTQSDLTAQLRGQPMVPMLAVADDTFVARGEPLVLTFQRDAGTVTGAVLNHASVHVVAARLSERAPRIERPALAVTAQALHEFTGDFRLDADTLVRVSVRNDTLTMQLSGRTAVALLAYARDGFVDAAGSCVLTFKRNASGLVSGLTLGLAGVDREAPRVRWVVPSLATQTP